MKYIPVCDLGKGRVLYQFPDGSRHVFPPFWWPLVAWVFGSPASLKAEQAERKKP